MRVHGWMTVRRAARPGADGVRWPARSTPLGGYALVGWVSVGCCLAAAAARAPVPRGAPDGGRRGRRGSLRAGVSAALRRPGVLLVVLAVALVGGLDAVEEYFPVLAADRGVPVTAVPVAILVIALAGAAGAASAAGRAGCPTGPCPVLLGARGRAARRRGGAARGGRDRRRGGLLRALPGGARRGRGPAAGPDHRPVPGHPHLGRGRGHRDRGAAGVRRLGGGRRARGRRRGAGRRPRGRRRAAHGRQVDDPSAGARARSPTVEQADRAEVAAEVLVDLRRSAARPARPEPSRIARPRPRPAAGTRAGTAIGQTPTSARTPLSAGARRSRRGSCATVRRAVHPPVGHQLPETDLEPVGRLRAGPGRHRGRAGAAGRGRPPRPRAGRPAGRTDTMAASGRGRACGTGEPHRAAGVNFTGSPGRCRRSTSSRRRRARRTAQRVAEARARARQPTGSTSVAEHLARNGADRCGPSHRPVRSTDGRSPPARPPVAAQPGAPAGAGRSTDRTRAGQRGERVPAEPVAFFQAATRAA